MDVEKCEDDHYVLADFRVLICIATCEKSTPITLSVLFELHSVGKRQLSQP
jgi:hypothetical protein